MKPIGILMREHRFIERMLAVLEHEKDTIQDTGRGNLDFLTAGIDFFRMYGDKNHHGKEEDIFFHELGAKPLTIEHRRMMSRFIDEHKEARLLVRTLDSARERYLRLSPGQSDEIKRVIDQINSLYTHHIEAEEKQFFYPATEYFSEEEQDKMIQEFYEFDKLMNKEKYENMVKQFETKKPLVMKRV